MHCSGWNRFGWLLHQIVWTMIANFLQSFWLDFEFEIYAKKLPMRCALLLDWHWLLYTLLNAMGCANYFPLKVWYSGMVYDVMEQKWWKNTNMKTVIINNKDDNNSNNNNVTTTLITTNMPLLWKWHPYPIFMIRTFIHWQSHTINGKGPVLNLLFHFDVHHPPTFHTEMWTCPWWWAGKNVITTKTTFKHTKVLGSKA